MARIPIFRLVADNPFTVPVAEGMLQGAPFSFARELMVALYGLAMLSAAAILASSLLLAAVVGFAAHRASICTVKAVAEIYATRRAFVFASFAKTVLWIMAAALVMHALIPEIRGQAMGWMVSLSAIVGGLVFGVGAVVNGGCAFSTLTRLGAGNVAMLATLVGFALGAGIHAQYLEWGTDVTLAVPYLARSGSWTGVITAVC